MGEGIVCFILCFGSMNITSPVQTYCQSYVRTVQKRDELEAILKLPRHLRNRIQGNDLHYLCRCKGLKDKACQNNKNPQ